MLNLTGEGAVFQNDELIAKVKYNLTSTTTRSGQERIQGKTKVLEGGDIFQKNEGEYRLTLDNHDRKFLFSVNMPHPPSIDPTFQIMIQKEIV